LNPPSPNQALPASRTTVTSVFAGTWIAYAGFYLCRKNFSVLMPALAGHLHFSKDQLATLVFCYSVTYAIGQFLSGALSDRIGGKRVVFLGMLTSAGCNLAMAAAGLGGLGMGAAAAALLSLAALQGINGFAQSAGWPGLLKITANWFDPGQRGILMAWWSTNYVIGGLVGTILATWFANGWPAKQLPALDWTLGASGPAIVLAVLALIFFLLVQDEPAHLRSDRPTRQQQRAASEWAWSEVLASPALRSIALCYFCLKLMRYTFLFWLPLYMVEKLHYGDAEAGYTSSIYELVGFLGVPLAGYLSDRVMRGRRFPVAVVMLFALAAACLIFPQLSAFSRVGNWVAIGLVGILTFGPDTLLAGAGTQDCSTPATAATAAGFVNGVGSLGQLVSPFLVSTAVRLTGWDGLFGVFVGIALLGALPLVLRWNGERPTIEVELSNA
jgi:sugar phosphate permease